MAKQRATHVAELEQQLAQLKGPRALELSVGKPQKVVVTLHMATCPPLYLVDVCAHT